MKTHSDRPAPRAVEVWRWIQDGILEIKVLKNTPIFHLSCGRTVYQRWLKRKRREVIVKHALTYLRKGIFLVPIWKVVSDWEIKYLLDREIRLMRDGVVFCGKTYQRLLYMQVDDLDHVLRQTVHTMDSYFEIDPLLAENFPELTEKLARQNQIISRIGNRQVGTDNLKIVIGIRLKSMARSLNSILANAPIFHDRHSVSDVITIANTLEHLALECATLTFRPVFRRLGYASRSLRIAAEHIRNGQFPKAKRCLRSALKNLTYPIEP